MLAIGNQTGMTKTRKGRGDVIGRGADPVGRVAREVRKAQVTAESQVHEKIRKGEIVREKDDPPVDPGTGFTIIKMLRKPLDVLIEKHKIGQEELDAAEEIGLAFYTLTSRLACRGINYERVDGGGGTEIPWPARVAGAVGRYQAFAKLWTRRSNGYQDPTLEIVIAVVVDERPIRGLAIDLHISRARCERALIGGLRDYAARAGLVGGQVSERWKRDAEWVFGPEALQRAASRARMER